MIAWILVIVLDQSAIFCKNIYVKEVLITFEVKSFKLLSSIPSIMLIDYFSFLKEKRSDLIAIKNSLILYKDARNREKGSLLSALLIQCNQLYQHILHSSNDLHFTHSKKMYVFNIIQFQKLLYMFLVVLLALAFVELALLKERYHFGQDLYDEDNRKVWLRDLLNKQQEYSDNLDMLYRKWQTWRKWVLYTITSKIWHLLHVNNS